MKRLISISKNAILHLSIIVLALAFTSCAKSHLDDYPKITGQDLEISMELAVPAGYSTLTKAMTSDQQNEITRAKVLVYFHNTLLYHRTAIIANINGTTKSIKVAVKAPADQADLFDIIVIGNPPSDEELDNYIGKTKEEFKEGYIFESTGKWNQPKFIMYGEAKQTTISATGNSFKIQMIRPLARLDVGLGTYTEATDTWSGLADFALTEVRIVNSRNKFSAVPTTTTIDGSGNVIVNAPSVPASAVVQGKDAATAIIYNGADVTSKSIQSTIFLAEAPNTTDRVTLLIGGSYDGGPTSYYKVEMKLPSKTTPGTFDYLNILRNHLYRVRVVNVVAPGFANPQEALDALPDNIEIELTATLEGAGNGDVLFDGSNYISTDASEVLIYDQPDGVKSYKIAKVKAQFQAGLTATVSGFGIATPITLTNGVAEDISVALPKSQPDGVITITIGRLKKEILVKVKQPIQPDATVLSFENVFCMNITSLRKWITMSQNETFVESEQKPSFIEGNAAGKAFYHIRESKDEVSRQVESIITRKTSDGALRVHIVQLPARPFISLDKDSELGIPSAGTTYKVKLTSNVAWSVSSADGLTFVPASGPAGTDMEVSITVPQNTTTAEVFLQALFTGKSAAGTTVALWSGTQDA